MTSSSIRLTIRLLPIISLFLILLPNDLTPVQATQHNLSEWKSIMSGKVMRVSAINVSYTNYLLFIPELRLTF